MKAGLVFEGIGGIGLGLERAGIEPAWMVEIDPTCRRVLARHWPDVPLYEDVKDVSGERLPAVDVLCGGFPCQDVSVAGRRAGLAGTRSGLFHEFVRLAAEIAPRWLLIENVPGLLSSNDRRDMGTVLGALADLGYGWAYRVLDAQYFGVAQRRRRVFVVGCLGEPARAAAVLLEPESCDGHPAPVRTTGTRPTVGTLGGTSPGGGWRVGADEAAAGQLVVSVAFYPHAGREFNEYEDVSPPITVGSGIGIPSPPGVAYSARGGSQQDEFVTPDGIVGALAHSSATHQGHHQPKVVYRKATKVHGADLNDERWQEDELAPTVDAAGHGPRTATAVVRDMAVRRLTPTECERLQGFPDGWTEGETDSARYRMLGNAVCVPVAQWIGARLLEQMESVA